MTEEIAELLNLLAEQFGTTIELLWGVYVKQATVNSIIYILFLIIYGLCIRFTSKRWGAWMKRIDDFDADAMWIVCWLVLMLSAGITIAAFSGSAITGLLNPEYWALQKILEMVR